MKEADEKFLKIFHNNLLGMLLTDENHLIVYVNDHLLQLAELKREDVIGKTGLELGLMDDDFVKKIWQLLLEKGEVSNIELSFTTKNKNNISVLFSTEQIELDDRPNWLTTIIDISKKKKAEEKISESELRFRTLAKTAPVGIFETDAKGLTTYVNETWMEYTGMDFEEAMGEGWLKAVYPEDRELLAKGWYSKTETAAASFSEYRLIDKQGKLRWVHGRAIPLINTHGEISGYIGTISDVTERKLAMESLRQSEETLNKAQGISKTGSWEFNPLTNELTWSREQYRIFELEDHPSPTLYEAYRNKYHPEDLPKLDLAISRAIEKAEGFTYEHRIICDDGSIKYILGIGEVVLDTSGKVIGLKGTGQDITENKKIEQEILESHLKVDTLINTIDGIVWEADADTGRFTFISKKAEDILGYPAESWLHEAAFWADHIHPEDRNWVVEYCINSAKEKKQYDFEYRMIAKNDSIVWLRDIVTVIMENDRPAQLRGIMIDITEKKKAEDEIRYHASLLENVSDAIISLDLERRIISWNRASEQMYGFTKEEVLGKRIPEIVVFEFQGIDIEAVFKQVYEQENWKGEIIFIHPQTGQQIIVLGNINLLRNKEGKITGFITTSKDITDRKQVENALNERTEQLRELSTYLQEVREEERTNIAREIHDELGQQLTGLKMDITWLRKKVLQDDPVIKNKFEDSIKLIDATVKTIRRIATELRPSIIDDLGLNAALDWQVSDFGKRLGIEIHYQNNFDDAHVNPNISIGLFRILQESLTNIARHAHAKNAIIKIEQVQEAIHLSVQDDGIGFDGTAKPIDKTFGLLGIEERTHKMNGNCLISSQPGSGTRVEVIIPLH